MSETVTVVVEAYPFEGAVGFQVEELTAYGWVEVLDTASVGTFPDYTTGFEVTATAAALRFRTRWKTGATSYTAWLAPVSIIRTPTADTQERLDQAVLAKAVRIYALAQAPYGTHGEISEFGAARVMKDNQILEILAGLNTVNWDTDLDTIASADVIRTLGYTSLSAAKTDDVDRALAAARSWVASHILGPLPIS